MNSLPSDSYTQLCDLVSQLHQQISKSKSLKQSLTLKNINFQLKNTDISLLDQYFSHRKHTPQQHTRLKYKVEWEIEQQIYQQQEMEKTLNFQKKREILENSEREVGKEEAKGEYGFLRSGWLHFKWNSSDEVDDRMDKLNKMISMMRGNVSKKILKEKKQGLEAEMGLEEQRMLGLESHRRYQSLMMQKEDLLARLKVSEEERVCLQGKNNQLQEEVSRQKFKLKQLQERYMIVSNKNLEGSKTSIQLSSLSALNQQSKEAEVYKYFNYVISITGKNVEPKETRIKRTLDQVREFLNPEQNVTENHGTGLAHSYSTTILTKTLGMSQNTLKRVVSNVRFQKVRSPAQVPRYTRKKYPPQQCVLE